MRSHARVTLFDVLASICVSVLIAGPMLFTSSGFAVDFTNHLWLSWAAGRNLVENGYPSFFLNTEGLGAFYPMFAFYGGTLYSLTGGLSELLGGQAIAAYLIVTFLGIIGTYGGTLWLARTLGVRGWMAHAPALAVVSSAYYITDLYGRGAWSELMAVSAVAPLVASFVYLARAPRLRALPVLVFVLSAVIFSGSHNLTLLWGVTLTVLALVVLWLALGAPTRLPVRRLALLAGLGLTSVMVNAWFLFPNLAYERDVGISHEPAVAAQTTALNSPVILFNPLRHVPKQSGTPALFLQIPDWFLAWGLATVLLLWRRPADDRLRRAWIAATSIVALILLMMMLSPFWEVVPAPFNQIQFPYRLGSFVSYAIAGLVIVGALSLQRDADSGRRRLGSGLRRSLVAVVAISVGLCVWQEWVPTTLFQNSLRDRAQALTSVNTLPSTWSDPGNFRDTQAPIVPVSANRVIEIEPALVHGDHFAAWMNVPAGPEPIRTNILGGAYLVHIKGLERVGRGPQGETVVRRIGGGSGPVHVIVETTHSAVIELGRAVSIVAVLLAALAVLISGLGTRRRKPSRTGQSDSEEPATVIDDQSAVT
jgi:hypothetical protein